MIEETLLEFMLVEGVIIFFYLIIIGWGLLLIIMLLQWLFPSIEDNLEDFLQTCTHPLSAIQWILGVALITVAVVKVVTDALGYSF